MKRAKAAGRAGTPDDDAGFFDDQARSQKVYGEMGELKNKRERFRKLSTQYEEAGTLLEMIEEENDPALVEEGEQAVNEVAKEIDELQLMTMLKTASTTTTTRF